MSGDLAGAFIARRFFHKRGNNSEAHVSETELAALLAVAFEKGVESQAERVNALIAALEEVDKIACRSAPMKGYGEEPPDPANRDGEELAHVARAAIAKAGRGAA